MPWTEIAMPVFAAALAAAAVHWWWRARFRAGIEGAQRRAEALQAECGAAVHRLESQQEALFNSMAEGLLVLDELGRIVLLNQACRKLFDLSTDVRGRTIIEALRLHELSETVSSLGPERPTVEQEIRITRPSEKWLQVSAAVVLDSGAQGRGAVLVFHDLTRLKYLENARKDFVANVSHELRTPLSLIKGYVETLVDGAYEDPKLCLKFLNIIQRNTDRLRLLIEDLLVLSEIESGRVSLNLQSVSLRALVQKVLEDFSPMALGRGMKLHNDCSDVTVRADSGRLEQVLGNLLDNAVKYGREGGCVAIGATPCQSGVVEVFVRDDGPGIPRESLERVFERFYRVDKARSRDQGGTGLGLSIVKHLVQSHGGRVWAEAEVGKGATFRFTLPAASKLSPGKNKQAGDQ